MSTDAVAAFIAQLRKAELLDAAQMAVVNSLRKDAERPAVLAGALLKKQWLTHYQANEIARGRGAELKIGSYIILEPLGQGGMGQVVKARHRYMKRLVALKFIHQTQRDSESTVKRFQREVELLAELRHPHIVHAYDAGHVDGIWFLAMELLEGVDLTQLVQKRGPLPVGEACSHIRQAALGLHYAHGRGLVHRDVKPSNLFLTKEGIKVLDLGLARPQAINDTAHAGDLTHANAVMGTPDYLSPEQSIDPRLADARSDIYSMGCTFFFLLAGRPPFAIGSLAQKLLHHQQTEPPAIDNFRDDVPPQVAALLRCMLAKNKDERPVNAVQVAAQLAPFISGTTRQATTATATAAKPDGTPTTVSQVPSDAPGSLIDSKASGAERGFTLNIEESINPQAAPSLISGKAAAPERGFTLNVDQSSSPAAETPAITPPASQPQSSAAPTGRTAILVGAGLGALLLLLMCGGGAIWIGGMIFSRNPLEKNDSQLAKIKKAGNKNKIKQTKEKVEPINPVNPPKPQYLEPMGPKEAKGYFLMPTIAPDRALSRANAGEKVYLSDLNETAVKTTPLNWKFAKNGRIGNPKNADEMIRVNGELSPKGLGMHPPNTDYIRACYALGKKAKSIHGAVALDDGKDPPWQIKPTYFLVIGDGKILWRSQPFETQGIREPFHVNVEDVGVLELRVYSTYAGANGSRAAWLDPYVVVAYKQ